MKIACWPENFLNCVFLTSVSFQIDNSLHCISLLDLTLKNLVAFYSCCLSSEKLVMYSLCVFHANFVEPNLHSKQFILYHPLRS